MNEESRDERGTGDRETRPRRGPSFDDLRPEAPDLEAGRRVVGDVLQGLAAAGTAEAVVSALGPWDALRKGVDTYGAWVHLRFSQDTRDEERRGAREAWDAAEPLWTELDVDVKRALLGHPLRDALSGRLGPQALSLWESQVLAFDPSLREGLVREAELGAQYTELLAGAQFEFRGETVNLPGLGKYRQHADREVRHAAERALWSWFGDQAEALDRIFDDLVRLRTDLAARLGLANFRELGYRRMCRVDYGSADVDRFRRAIREHVVPLAGRIVERQARDLGVERVMAWDEPVHDPRGNPVPRGTPEELVATAQRIFDELHPELGSFFRTLEEGGFLDLVSRPGKAGGGFCTAFTRVGMPFVFANFNGTKGDVEVLTHEIGHAFQYWCSRELEPLDYVWPTNDAAEVHSMGLELLTHPQMEAFFGQDAERFRRIHLTECLLFLPYGTAVDHFQHLVYENPSSSPEERCALWREMERMYLPWRDWGDLERPVQGGRWQHQRHIYLAPFYYIDYVLAQTCALQLWDLAAADRADALERYAALCHRGGSLPFQALVADAGLESPFDEACLPRILKRARSALDLDP